MMSMRWLTVCLILLLPTGFASAAEAKPEPAAAEASVPQQSVAELAARAAKSVVIVSYRGRDGGQAGLGTGFIVSPDGLVATNLHVIGEARPISVRTAEGKEHKVVAVHATDRSVDLALIRIDARDLPALPLAEAGELKQGEPVVAIGNPRGLKHSVVAGVVSGRREIDGMPMIQLAIPIEAGNSGGPLLDMQGRVHGILTLKSLVTENLGFAVEIGALKPLLDKPNPVPISRWLTIGALDPREWTTLFGAEWRQRSGRILVEGLGGGFGGRSLVLSKSPPPEMPYEVAVEVRLASEEGAAGLVFHADGNQKHYGFYPSGGRLRLSRFDGPDVFNWQVLSEVRSDAYRSGEWNRLKVRLTDDAIRCFVNEELVIESNDTQFSGGQIGLAKFRDTKAEFRRFRAAKELPSQGPTDEIRSAILAQVAEIPLARPPEVELIGALVPQAETAADVLRDRARQLERQAERLRQLSRAVHAHKTRDELAALFEKPEDEIDLLRAALLLSRLDNDEVDVDGYVAAVERMVRDIGDSLADEADEAAKLAALNKHLFDELGFHGSRTDYYNRSNSYLNEVIDDREGLPITLSVLYIELARRLDLTVVGVGLPGHFIVRFEPQEGEPQLLDPFDRAKPMTREQAVERVTGGNGQQFDDEWLASQSKQAILIRMVRNLMSAARDANDLEAMLRYVDVVLALDPDSAQDRMLRAVVCYQTDRIEEAIADTDWILKEQPEGLDLDRVRQLRKVLEEAIP